MLSHWNTWLSSRRFSLSLGQWRKICIFIGCARSWKKTFLTIQNNIVNNKKYLWKNNGRSKYNCPWCARRHGKKFIRIWSYLGRIWTDICFRIDVNRSWCQKIHNGSYRDGKGINSYWIKRKVTRKNFYGYSWIQF